MHNRNNPMKPKYPRRKVVVRPINRARTTTSSFLSCANNRLMHNLRTTSRTTSDRSPSPNATPPHPSARAALTFGRPRGRRHAATRTPITQEYGLICRFAEAVMCDVPACVPARKARRRGVFPRWNRPTPCGSAAELDGKRAQNAATAPFSPGRYPCTPREIGARGASQRLTRGAP